MAISRDDRLTPADRDWILPAAILTIALGLVAVGLSPFVHLRHPAAMLFSVAGWCFWTIAAIGAAVLIYTFKLMRAGEERPIAKLLETRADLNLAPLVAGMLLAGFDMVFFMWLKPELDVLFPFWADPLLANFDHAIFGQDPWRLLMWLNIDVMAAVYGIAWFLGVELTFFWLMLKPPSRAKTVAVVAYFLTWSVFGPIGQALLSSAGPIFYERLGLGGRFLAMPSPEITRITANYLWTQYGIRGAGVGVGISAMPSLHIASMAWLVLAFASFRSRLVWPALALTLYIWAGSVALGWHYVTDGLVGAAGAVACFYVVAALFSPKDRAEAGIIHVPDTA